MENPKSVEHDGDDLDGDLDTELVEKTEDGSDVEK